MGKPHTKGAEGPRFEPTPSLDSALMHYQLSCQGSLDLLPSPSLLQSQLVVVIIPKGSDGSVYQSVKKFCCLELGIPSQAIRAKNILANGFIGIVRNVALQIVCKLGGAPWALDVDISDVRENNYELVIIS